MPRGKKDKPLSRVPTFLVILSPFSRVFIISSTKLVRLYKGKLQVHCSNLRKGKLPVQGTNLVKGKPPVRSSNLREMEDRVNMHHRRLRSAALLCCCCFGSEDTERSLLKPSWLQKVARSNSGSEAAAMDLDSPKWWRKGWNSVRRAGEWSETLVDDYAGGCCSGRKWKNFVRRCKADGRSIYSTRPARFHYDQMDYQLNFDEGGFQGQGLSESPGSSSKLFKGGAGTTAAL